MVGQGKAFMLEGTTGCRHRNIYYLCGARGVEQFGLKQSYKMGKESETQDVGLRNLDFITQPVEK